MNGNKIGNKGGMALAGALQVNTVLEELDLGETDLVSNLHSMFKVSLCLRYGEKGLKYASLVQNCRHKGPILNASNSLL